ncbi:hypothetical protein M3603_15425 [Rummeliibacillus stabekisii]|uniref:hypothetical protein n=1 Tax=Rummeliibacillus stabekisii TaxID=241244 RepID=UPI00203D5C66|nr:hypothetical protein [Rummeliibacillus stabekisii]MCM3318008.1 hypothetical protein [Rummeliibacillus stabekisii]
MIYLENLFLLGFIASNLIYESFLPYYLHFVNLTSPVKKTDDIKQNETVENKFERYESVKSWSMPSTFETNLTALEETECLIQEIPTYEMSELDAENSSFLANLLTDLEGPAAVVSDEEHQLPVHEDTSTMLQTYEEYAILTMDDWHEQSVPFEPEQKFTSNVTARIGDKYFGLQTWVCSVVGYEENYIHVLDGQDRAWAHLPSDDIQLAINDTIEVSVNRTESKIEVLNLKILKSNESHLFHTEQEEAIDEYSFEELEIYTKTAEA